MHILAKLLDSIFPPACGFCGELNNNYICNNCIQKIAKYKRSQINNYSNTHFTFHEHFYLFKYESDIRDKIIQYKFQEKSYLYKTFAKLFIEDENFQNCIKDYNLITCVPLHKKRFDSRGYNQSDLIAKEIATHLNIPYCKDFLIKKNSIVAQSTLNKAERLLNIKNAFELNLIGNGKTAKDLPLSGLKIAVFDDIFTTGATANECAKVIQALNPSKIGIITIAKD